MPPGVAAPSGVLPPPPGWVEARELAFVRYLNSQHGHGADQFTTFLAEKGGREMWFEFARQYRRRAGFIRGWLGTGLLAVTLALNGARTQHAKRYYDRLRPYQVDPSIKPIGPLPGDASYPSGHTSTAYAGATVMSFLWPARSYEFNWWARQVGLSRIHAGVHWPSDVKVGALLGQRNAMDILSVLF